MVKLDPIEFYGKPNSSYIVREHDELIVPCAAVGQPMPTIQWFKVCLPCSFDDDMSIYILT
jgi:hypothetical protein